VNIARTLDGSWTNWSVNRMMFAGKDTRACMVSPPQQLGIIRCQRTRQGEPMPIALGVEPGLVFAGCMPLPAGVDETHYLGALLGEPIELVPAETIGLLVRTTAEIIVDGHVAADETVMEGR
jgi:4-hydroxy-3-polyprenylbenzoate decarboxylase